jgi:phage I-like protein
VNRSDVEHLPLRAFRISNGALQSAPNLPSRLKLLSWGRNESTKGPVIVGDKTAQVLPAIQPQLGFGKVALDFEHNTVPGTEAHKESVEPRPVAAYGVPKVVPGDGLYLEDIEWTPRGRTEALNFADLSPAVKQDADGQVVFIHSAALTRNGSVHELSFYSAAVLADGHKSGANQKKPGMDETITVGELGGALGIASPTKATVLSRLALFSAVSAALESLTKEADGKRVLIIGAGDLTALSARLKAVEEKAGTEVKTFSVTVGGQAQQIAPAELAQIVVDMRGQLTDAARNEVITALSAEGKAPINPETNLPYSAEELGAMDLKTLKTLRANTPGTVPLSAASRRAGGESRVTAEVFAAEVGKLMTGSGMDRDAATLAARKKLGC